MATEEIMGAFQRALEKCSAGDAAKLIDWDRLGGRLTALFREEIRALERVAEPNGEHVSVDPLPQLIIRTNRLPQPLRAQRVRLRYSDGAIVEAVRFMGTYDTNQSVIDLAFVFLALNPGISYTTEQVMQGILAMKDAHPRSLVNKGSVRGSLIRLVTRFGPAVFQEGNRFFLAFPEGKPPIWETHENPWAAESP
jgi:hypothetical protein